MPKSVQKITLSQSRDIPFNRLVLSQANVRRIKADGRAIATASPMPELPSESPVQLGDEESAAIGGETAVVDFKISTEDEAAATDPHAIAAE
jgi:hypothetical protein